MTDSPYNLPPGSKQPQGQSAPPSSGKKEPDRKPLEPIVKAKIRKPSIGKRIANTFTGADMHSVGSYVLMDVVIPAVKDLLFDVLTQGSQKAIYGEVRGRGRTVARQAGYVAYNAISSAKVQAPSTASTAPVLSNRERSTHDFSQIIIDNMGTANEILDRLRETIKEFDVATVADFFDLVEITSSFTDVKWGWTDPTMGSVVRAPGEGYWLDLPLPVSLKG